MRNYLVALGLVAAMASTVAADTKWSRENHYYDRDGGKCSDDDTDGRQFYGYVAEGMVDFSEERKAYVGGSLQEMYETRDGLIQMLLKDESTSEILDWHTFDPKNGYIAVGKLFEPDDVKAGHLMSYPLVACK
jgi:hypothetical protein